MVTQVQIDEEAHIVCIKKQTEYREKGLKIPSVTALVNKAVVTFMKDVPVDQIK